MKQAWGTRASMLRQPFLLTVSVVRELEADALDRLPLEVRAEEEEEAQVTIMSGISARGDARRARVMLGVSSLWTTPLAPSPTTTTRTPQPFEERYP